MHSQETKHILLGLSGVTLNLCCDVRYIFANNRANNRLEKLIVDINQFFCICNIRPQNFWLTSDIQMVKNFHAHCLKYS